MEGENKDIATEKIYTERIFLMKKILAFTLALLMSFSCFSIISFAEETQKTTEHLTEVPEGYTGIYTKEELNSIRNKLSVKYILMNDIVFTDSDYQEDGLFYNSGEGWQPITTFAGVFDGNGYKIKNLKCNMPDKDYVGLFGKASSATIKNVILVNADITGNYYVGGICGYYTCNEPLENCVVSGTISGNKNVGGIIGMARRYDDSGSSVVLVVTKCTNLSDVSAEYFAGGIVGYLDLFGVIINSYPYTFPCQLNKCINMGNIITSGYGSGGIVGGSDDANEISYTYNAGKISAPRRSGGIIGCGANSHISQSYSVGYSSEGGIIGENYFNDMSSCYYANDVGTVSSKYGYGVSTAEMQQQSTYSTYDFDSIWTMGGREDYPYPELQEVPLVFVEDLIHEHEYTKEITTEPTHLTEGIKTFTCACGDSYTEAIAKLEDHTYTSEVTKEATHLEEGETTYTCACGDSYTEPVAKLKEHSYTSEVTTEPTHLTEGVKTFTCACGDSYTEPVAKLEDHTYTSEVTTEPTHLTEGVKTFTCACGDSYTEPVAKLEGHTYTSEVTKEATHLEEGETTYTCECGDSYTEAISKLTGHTYKEVVTEPTCTAKGYTTYTCACGDTYVDNYVGIKEHSYSSSITTPATHTKEGVMTYTCSSCGDTYTAPVAKTPEHAYTNSYVVEPTCEKEGYTAHVCDCGDIIKDNYTEKTGHSYNGRVCEDCGKNCSCMCHYSGFMSFIWKIINFFYKLFRVNKVCACGIAHY